MAGADAPMVPGGAAGARGVDASTFAASPVPKKRRNRRKKNADVAMVNAPAVGTSGDLVGVPAVRGHADDAYGGGLDDEWADALPARPTRMLALRPSRERSPKRRVVMPDAATVAAARLVPGCLATGRGLDAGADLDESIVELLELDEDTSR